MRRLFGRSLFWGVVLLQLPENLEFHLERLTGANTWWGVNWWRDPRRWEAYGKSASWFASLKRIGCGGFWILWIQGECQRLFSGRQGTQLSPLSDRGLLALSSAARRNVLCLLYQTPILEPSRISGCASCPGCAAEVISVLTVETCSGPGKFSLVREK